MLRSDMMNFLNWIGNQGAVNIVSVERSLLLLEIVKLNRGDA